MYNLFFLIDMNKIARTLGAAVIVAYSAMSLGRNYEIYKEVGDLENIISLGEKKIHGFAEDSRVIREYNKRYGIGKMPLKDYMAVIRNESYVEFISNFNKDVRNRIDEMEKQYFDLFWIFKGKKGESIPIREDPEKGIYVI